jgi:bifunctional non-homologous end joining protein LigD
MQIIKPMLAKASDLPERDDHYAYEIKWDGIRAIIYIEGKQLKIFSRNSLDITGQYPELQELANSCKSDRIILDGEIIAFDSHGRPSFELLQQRMNLVSPKSIAKVRQQVPIHFVIFDILALDQCCFFDLSYLERRNKLENLRLNGPHWQTPSYTLGTGAAMLEATRKLGLEGIIAKRLQSTYYPGQRTGDWLKIKNIARQELLIGGWIPGKGNRSGKIGALLVGYYDQAPIAAKKRGSPPQLVYAGKVGSGFNEKTLETLKHRLEALSRPNSPFSESTPKLSRFVEPQLIGEFEFTEWTSNHTLRHPVFKGLRLDKEPKLVTRET